MANELQSLIANQNQKIEDLRKRIAGIDERIARGQQERNSSVADIIMAQGHLEGLKEALGLQTEKKENESAVE